MVNGSWRMAQASGSWLMAKKGARGLGHDPGPGHWDPGPASRAFQSQEPRAMS